VFEVFGNFYYRLSQISQGIEGYFLKNALGKPIPCKQVLFSLAGDFLQKVGEM
jgi:hypothetical protein